jgi:two-component system, sensor histidine kinase
VKLRSQLVLLALVALLPVAILAAVLGAFLIDQQRDTFRQGTKARVHALITAVDAEVKGSIDVLRALANVRSLDERDLKLFRESAAQILEAQDNWTNINLARPDGQQIVNLRAPEGSPLPKLPEKDQSLKQVLTTMKPAVGDLLVGPVTNQWDFAVRVPVIRGGKIQYILSAVVDPASIGRLVASQGLPADWEGMVVDRNARIVARSVEPSSIGQFASENGTRQ